MIGDEVTVTVLRVKGNQVRLGVNAPKSVSVQREEIFHRIKHESAEPRRPSTTTAESAPAAAVYAPLCPCRMIPLRMMGRPARRDGRVVEGAPLLRV